MTLSTEALSAIRHGAQYIVVDDKTYMLFRERDLCSAALRLTVFEGRHPKARSKSCVIADSEMVTCASWRDLIAQRVASLIEELCKEQADARTKASATQSEFVHSESD